MYAVLEFDTDRLVASLYLPFVLGFSENAVPPVVMFAVPVHGGDDVLEDTVPLTEDYENARVRPAWLTPSLVCLGMRLDMALAPQTLKCRHLAVQVYLGR